MCMGRMRWLGLVYGLVAFLGVGMATHSASVLAAPSAQAKTPTKDSAVPSKASMPAAPEAAQGEPVFAMVNDKPVTVREYRGLLAETMRQRYYHGTIPEGKAEELYKEIADLVIDQELQVGEADKRGIKPDPALFEKTLAELNARYAADPKWEESREQLLPQIKVNMGRQSKMKQLEKAVRDVPQPTQAEARTFYDKNPDLFTEPERLHVSIILLKVDPGGTKAEWDLAREEAQNIYGRIKDGADFAQQARLHSQHSSAAKGGDMGYLHGGMLPQGMEDKFGMLSVGEVSEPVTTLEGIVLSRIEQRIPAKLRDFKEVEKRAQDLLKRDRANQAWQNTLTLLRAGARIKILAPQVPGGK